MDRKNPFTFNSYAEMRDLFGRLKYAEDVRGVVLAGEQPVERLYREIRSLRIYEGAIEVQQLIIARELLSDVPKPISA